MMPLDFNNLRWKFPSTYFLDVGKPLNFQNIAKIERLCLRIVEHFLNPFIDEFIRNRNTSCLDKFPNSRPHRNWPKIILAIGNCSVNVVSLANAEPRATGVIEFLRGYLFLCDPLGYLSRRTNLGNSLFLGCLFVGNGTPTIFNRAENEIENRFPSHFQSYTLFPKIWKFE